MCRDMRPAAHLLFFAPPKKRRQKKGGPTCRVPALRFGQPVVLARGEALRNSLCSLRSRRSNSRSESVHEARASCSALALPSRSVPRHDQRGRGPDSGHCFARPWFFLGYIVLVSFGSRVAKLTYMSEASSFTAFSTPVALPATRTGLDS